MMMIMIEVVLEVKRRMRTTTTMMKIAVTIKEAVIVF
jgi:hypothetical protein